MTNVLSSLLDIATLVFAVSSMLSVGFSYTVRELIEPLRNPRLVIGALVANFVLVPLLAYAITGFLSLGEGREIGLLLVAGAAGAPFLIKLTQAADGDVALASGLLVLLVMVTIGYMPIVVPLIAPGAEVSATSIAMPLVLTMLLPLMIGLFIDAKFESWADRLQPLMNRASSLALVVLLVTTLLTNFGRIVGVFGTGTILAALLFIAGAFVIGYLLGMTGRGTREELSLATAQRNVAAAAVVAAQSFGDPDTLVMVVVTSLVTMMVLFPLARALSKRQEQQAETRIQRAAVRHKEPLV